MARDRCRRHDETIISNLLEGQFANPVRVIGFNAAEGWSKDVSEDVARDLRQRCGAQDRELPDFLERFVERYTGSSVQLLPPTGS